jgi:hypothetical protein
MREASSFRTRIWHAVAFCLLGMMAYVVYGLQLQYTNAYMGFQPLVAHVSRRIIILALCVLLGLSLPTSPNKPSHFFLLLYGAFTILSYILFAGSAYEEGLFTFIAWLLLLLVPYVAVHLLGRTNWTLMIRFELRRETVLLAAVAIVLAAVAVALMNSRQSGGLTIADAYERRMVGRDIFQSGSFIAYLNVMSMNGINPFIAFLGGLLNRKSLALLAAFFAGVFFFSVGVKAPMAVAGLAYLVGLGVRSGRPGIFFHAVIIVTALLFLTFLIEYAGVGYSQVAEYYFRRIFVIPGFDVQHYMGLMFESGGQLWSPWTGINSDLSPTFLIGALFFGNVQDNVNTNAFIYALAAGGFPAYVATIAFVGGLLKAFDALYAASSNAGYLYLGFLFSILVTEQSATTALVSSGVGLLFGLLVLSGKGWSMADTFNVSRGLKLFRTAQ